MSKTCGKYLSLVLLSIYVALAPRSARAENGYVVIAIKGELKNINGLTYIYGYLLIGNKQNGAVTYCASTLQIDDHNKLVGHRADCSKTLDQAGPAGNFNFVGQVPNDGNKSGASYYFRIDQDRGTATLCGMIAGINGFAVCGPSAPLY